MSQTEAVEAKTEAAAMPIADSDGIESMYLTFAVGDESYGVSIGMVTEIVGMQTIMSVPDVPHYIKGVINLRGKVIPLMDVRLRFGIEERPYDERTVVIVLEVDDAPIGMIVDRVSEVLDVPADKIDRTGNFGGGEGKSMVSALARIEDRLAILLDVHALVSDADLKLPDLS